MMAQMVILFELFLLVLIALIKNMINYKILSDKEKNSRYTNMRYRCGEEYQHKNPKYIGTNMCKEWQDKKVESFYEWLDNNFYVVDGEQMDIDKDIICYGNKQYHPDMCIIAPHP